MYKHLCFSIMLSKWTMRCGKIFTTEASIGADPPDLSVSDVTDQAGSLLAQTSFAMMSAKAEGDEIWAQ